jgi:hydrogenase maturation protein HypF
MLTDSANPIVLLPARPGNGLASAIHPGLDCVGLMLPTTPLHWMLLRDSGRPLVVTSGNREGEPLAVDIEEALDRLRDIADLWLHHDRSIARPVDDSVVRIVGGRPMTLRLARGLAPMSLAFPAAAPAVAVGGQQKSSIALSNGAQTILGPHVGDLGTTRTRERFTAELASAVELYGTRQPLWIHDLHPDYFTTQWAQDQIGQKVAVQHHHAHVVTTMLEHGWLDREVLGVAFDGTGYGTNGTIWGGEFLLTTAAGFRRVAHLREFRLPGGEAAIREPWRVAVSLVQQAKGAKAFSRVFSDALHEKARRLVSFLDRPQVSPRTTSAGRLFDGVAALTLGVERAEFEGYPAMQLEAAADRSVETGYTFPVMEATPLQLDWRPMVVELLADRRKGTSAGVMSMRFHRGLAYGMAAVCRRFAPLPIVLGGGVFQNRLLTELLLESLADSQQPVGLPGRIPPNDGGLAAGQLAIALAVASPKGD